MGNRSAEAPRTEPALILMDTIKQRVAKIAAPPLGCGWQDVVVREERVSWIRRMRAFRALGAPQHPGLLVVMPNGELAPPLVFAALPVWEQHWTANALLRVEDIWPNVTLPEELADICRTTLAGPGGRVATIALARRELRDPRRYDELSPFCQEIVFQERGKQWYARFTFIAPDGALEGWQVAGFEQSIYQAECELYQSSGAWPAPRVAARPAPI
jgi:hypothetical protein